jgi:hypothetical protein
MKRHLFILSLSWHSGDYLIYYAWGTPTHDTPSDESPDNIAFFEISKQMSNFAGGQTKYIYGPANQMFYSGGVFGAWSDYAYASTWDINNLTSGFATPGARSLAIGIEISQVKKPPENTLGQASEVFNPKGEYVDGFIPQNIRMALVVIDLVEPYVNWEISIISSIPTIAYTNSKITLNWSVNGSFTTTNTRILYGQEPNPISEFQYNTSNKSGDRSWTDAWRFSENIILPEVPGDYYFVANAQVDQRSLLQNAPEPPFQPQSFFVKQRTDDSWKVSNNNNTLQGSKNWYSPIIHIKVINQEKNKVWFSEFDEKAISNEPFNISWSISTDGEINYTKLYWGQDPDPINNSEYQSNGILDNNKNNTYNAQIVFPSKPGIYYFSALMSIIPGSSETLKDAVNVWSTVLTIDVSPQIPYRLEVSLPTIEYINAGAQTLEVKDIRCFNLSLSFNSLDDTGMLEHKILIRPFDPEAKMYLDSISGLNYSYDLEWSSVDNYWFLTTQNISFWNPGYYQVISQFKHKYGEGESDSIIDLEIANWFILKHIIIVTPPEITINGEPDEFKIINILNVTSWSSYSPLDYLDGTEIENSSFEILNSSTQDVLLTSSLSWSWENSTWQALNVNISDLPAGSYFVNCKFTKPPIGTGNSDPKKEGNAEFIITSPSKNNGDDKDERKNTTPFVDLVIIITILILIVIIILFLILILRIRKKH